jgi:hypothetical protein
MTSIIPIRDWSDGYAALKHHAEQARGALESNFCPDGQWQRWPRTTGNDAFLIAVFLHPHLVKVEMTEDAWRRWLTCLGDVLRWGITNPHAEYRENRKFWEEVLRVCVFLATEFAPPPKQVEWEVLFEELACEPHRNGVLQEAPFGPFKGIETYKDLYVAQVLHLQKERGMDRMEPGAGMPGGVKNIPRSTNADVEALMLFWSRQLAKVKSIIGTRAAVERWSIVVKEVQEIVKGGKPADVYPKNNQFWRELNAITTHISVAEQAPSVEQRVVDSIEHGFNELPNTLSSAARAAAGGVVDGASAIAGGVGSVAGGLLGGLFSALKVPLMVVGGGLAGIFLLSRRSAGPTSEKA